MICRKGMGLLKVTNVSETQISFRNGSNVFSYHLDNGLYEGCGTFAAGHVIEGEKIDLTFKSEYQKMGTIKTAKFIPYFIQETDSPKFIVTNAIHFILNN